MANKKFSEFNLKTSNTDVQFVVGYNGSENVRISPSDVLGDYLPLTGGTLTGTLTGTTFIGNVTGDVTGDLTGNADTSTKIASITNSDIVQLTTSQTLTNKSGDISQWTNDANYSTTTGTVTPTSTDTFTNKSGAISQWTNDSGYLTSESDSQTLSFSSPSISITGGNSINISALTTGLITASSTDTLTNKSGSNNQWTNDSGYITSYVDTTYTAGTGLLLTGTVFSNTITNNNQLTNGAGYTTNLGTVTSVATGDGLSGGTITSTGNLTVDSTVVRTAGTQAIGGAKTFTDNIVVTGSTTPTGGIIDSNGDLGTAGQVLSSTGTALDWIDAAAGGGVDGISSVYVAGVGTSAQNGTALINGYAAAVAKIQNVSSITNSGAFGFDQNDGGGRYQLFNFGSPGWTGYTTSTNYTATYGTTPAQTLIWRIDSSSTNQILVVDITDTLGNPQSSLTIDTSGVPILASSTTPAHLIIGPGKYDLPSSLVINDVVSVVSLTGQKDVNITGYDVQVSSGANAKSTIIAGLNLQNNKFIVDTGLGNITVKNVEARANGSFDSASGGGNLSGTFIDCFGGYNSFASSSGANASGKFIRCDAKELGSLNGFSFGSNGGNTSGYFDSCGSLIAGVDFGGGRLNFGRTGNSVGGFFYYCKGQQQSFGNGATSTNGKFTNCQSSGNQSFGVGNQTNSGTFNFCTSGSTSFGSEPFVTANTTNAKYYYCIAQDNDNFGSGFGGAQSTYTGCVAGSNSFGAGFPGSTASNLYNCQMTSGTFAAVTGTGKIRNCIDNTFTIINLG